MVGTWTRLTGGVMENWLGFVAFIAAWVVLQVWILPKLGVPT